MKIKNGIYLVIMLLLMIAGFFLFWNNQKLTQNGINSINDNEEEKNGRINSDDDEIDKNAKMKVRVFAGGLGAPRVMIIDPAGRILTSITSQGKVIALPDEDADGKADRVITLLDKLNRPHGLAIKCESNNVTQKCFLFVAESNAVSIYDYDQSLAKASNKRKIIDLPEGGRHFTRTILIHNNKLYTSVGSSCDVCYEEDWRRAKILISDLDGKNLKAFASGLRNAVFMTVNPKSNQIWATEMGRDFLGDNLPPDEINIIKEGANYGWPICYGDNIHDNQFDKNQYIRNPCENKAPAHINLQAHVAPLGLAFIPENGFPKRYQNNLLVAYHGSWNRSQPVGYKVVRFILDETGKVKSEEDFFTPEDGGRPADILILEGRPFGVIYISDDKLGKIYWITFENG